MYIHCQLKNRDIGAIFQMIEKQNKKKDLILLKRGGGY